MGRDNCKFCKHIYSDEEFITIRICRNCFEKMKDKTLELCMLK